MQVFKSSVFAAVIYFSFAITNITTGPGNFIWSFPTAIFKQYLWEIPCLFHKNKALFQTHAHHSEGME